MRLGIYLALSTAAAALGGCGGSSGGGGDTVCNPGASASMTIKSTGVAPSAVCVLPGGTVTFTNSDTVQHQFVSDASCTELDTGVIAASGSVTRTFPSVKNCSFHDSGSPSNTAFQGTVAVTTAPATGPGY